MALIEQDYDIDLKPDAARPVVQVSQYDTGSRTIVFTVFDGSELAGIDGCTARVDGSRGDGTNFSVSATVGTGSNVSFPITQEMTNTSGLHTAELVILDASGTPIGTQNFLIEVEPSPMNRALAASADDRTLYDQYTSSIESKFSNLSTSLTTELTEKTDALTKTVQDIDALLGGSSNAVTLINQDANGSAFPVHVNVVYDPISGMVACSVQAKDGIGGITSTSSTDIKLVDIPTDYLPSEEEYSVHQYILGMDGYSADGTTSDWGVKYWLNESGALNLTVLMPAGETSHIYPAGVSATWQARGGRYMGVTPIPTGSNTVTVGTTTTVNGGAQASVTNSGTAKDVVLDFEIPTQSFKGAGEDSVSISANGDAQATERAAIAIGKKAQAAVDSSIAIGNNAKAIHSGGGSTSVVIGSSAVGGLSAVCIGSGAGTRSGLGNPIPNGSVNVGQSAYAPFSHSVAIGESAEAVGHNKYVGSDAYGSNAYATGAASVALGCYSYATDDNVVSVGQGDSGVHADGERVRTRRIVNVTDPVNAQDAATKAYVDALIAKLKSDNNLN